MISILGGTFDPIHNGHLYIAGEVTAAFSPREIVFVPGKEPPHRDTPAATATQRAAMVKLAIADHKQYKFSDVELERPGPSYTIDTIKTLKKLYPDDEVTLIIGDDAYHDFTNWLHWEEILEYGKLIVVNRHPDISHQRSDELIDPASIYTLQVTPCPISATHIRNLIHAGKPIDELVPAAVKDYIEEQQLYR